MSNWQQMMPTPRAYSANRVLFDLHHKSGDLARYKADPRGYLTGFELDEELRNAFLNDEIGALYLAGANPYLLRAHCVGMRIPEQKSVASLRAVMKDSANG